MKYNFIYLLCCFSLGVFGITIRGWSSNSIYAILGSIRSLAQSISYEVRLAILLITIIIIIEKYNFNEFLYYNINFRLILIIWPIIIIFLIRIIAELNRTPFDFSEGESELVRGFNVEYRRGGFIIIFLSEYTRILFISLLFILIFIPRNFNNFLFFFKIILLSTIIIWIRGTLPRFRYDLLIYLCWIKILPFSLYYILFILIYKFFI